MTLTEAYLLLKQGGTWPIIAAIPALVPLVYRGIKDAVPFHNDFIRHYRLRNIERATQNFEVGSADREFLEELKAQEVFYINTGLWLSKTERLEVLEWLKEKPITLKLLRDAWPHISFEKGYPYPKLNKGDVVFMWYGLFASVLMLFLALALGLLSIVSINSNQSFTALLLTLFFALLFVAMLGQTKPYFSARRLKSRLEIDAPNKALQPTVPPPLCSGDSEAGL